MEEGLGGLAGVDAYTADHGFEDGGRGAEVREGHHKLIQSQWAIWRIHLRKFVNLNVLADFYFINLSN